MIQSVLKLPGHDSAESCPICGMSYSRSSESDQALHKKYHFTFVEGPVFDVSGVSPLKTFRLLVDKKSHECKVFAVKNTSLKMVRKTEAMLDMVNLELNAPKENDAWKKNDGSPTKGKAYVATINKRAVAVCLTEPIVSVERQARWMVHRTQDIVPSQINRNSKIGISRIWVASHWRRQGIGLIMLDVIMKHSIYGVELSQKDIAFSQPSSSGGLLAKKFCGVKHKSGETLVPVYLEES